MCPGRALCALGGLEGAVPEGPRNDTDLALGSIKTPFQKLAPGGMTSPLVSSAESIEGPLGKYAEPCVVWETQNWLGGIRGCSRGP